MIALSIVFLILAGAFNRITPYESPPQCARLDGGQANPDEHGHMAYIKELARGRLPVFRAGGQDYEAHQPPLYYLLCEPVYLAARGEGDAKAAGAVRWVSTLLGLALIWVAFFAVADLFPEDPRLAVLAAGFIALLPMNVSLESSVTNDSLTNLVAALGVWQMVRIAKGICRRPHSAAILGVVLGLGIWTKTSTLVLFPTVIAFYWLLARGGTISMKTAAWRAALACGLGLLIGLPWFIRNTLLYGDPLARHIFVSAFQNTAKTSMMLAESHAVGLSSASYVVGVAQWTFASFWGIFDSMTWFWGRDPQYYGNLGFFQGRLPAITIGQPPGVYTLLSVACVLSLIGLLRYFRQTEAKAEQAAGVGEKAVLGAFAVLIVMTLLAFIGFNLTFFQAQGRYLYTALVPIAFFFVLGLRSLLPKPYGSALVVLALAGLAGLDIFSIAMLAQRFGGS